MSPNRRDLLVSPLKTVALLLGLTLAFLLPAACTSRALKNSRNSRKMFIESIQRAGRSPTGVFDMRELLPFAWDRFLVLPANAHAAEVNSKLGFQWDDLNKSRSQILPQFLLLVFVKGQKVAAWIDLDRNRYSFEPFLDRGYVARADSLFDIRGAGRRRVEISPRRGTSTTTSSTPPPREPAPSGPP